MPRKLILDVDTGNDDAVAVMFAALHPDLDLLGCTTVWGNHDVARTTDNTLRVLDHIGRSDIGVHPGLGHPFAPGPASATALGRPSRHAPELPLPPPTSTPHETSAIDWLLETIRSTPEPITLVQVGPLTNLAAAVTVDSSVVDVVDTVVIMGGSHAVGNITPSAETNVWRDPVAADVVLRAGFRDVVLVPLDATHQAAITAEQCRELDSLGTPAAVAAAACIAPRLLGPDENEPGRKAGTALVHDPLCVAYLVDPDVVSLFDCHVAIETAGRLTYGRTVIDTHRRGGQEPNTSVAMAADADRYFALLRSTFARTAD